MEYEIKPASKFSVNAKEIWSYKELFYFFTWRDIKVKYKQAALGMAWAILQPTIMMLVFTFLFSTVMQQDPHSALPYAVYVYSGLMLWGIFSNGIQAAGNSMVANANIIKKIYFPRLIIPLSSILVAVFDFIMTLVPFVLLLFYYHIEINAVRLITLLPLSLLLILFTTIGLGCFLSALNVKYRDFRFVIPFLVQFSLYTSPIVYKMGNITNTTIKFLLSINPISVAVEIYRSAFDPTVVIDYSVAGIGIGITFICLILGIYYFRKTESYFADLA